MREWWLTAVLVMRSRAWTWALAITLLALILVQWVPEHTIVIEVSAGLIGRQIWSAEWMPIIAAIALTLALAPRFPLWDRLGSARTRGIAAITNTLIPAIALLLGWARIAWSVRITGLDYVDPIVLLNNIYAITALTLIMVALLGRAWGTVTLVVFYIANVQLQTRAPEAAEWLPLLWGERADGEFDLIVRWPWLIALTLVLAAVTWQTRNVPTHSLRTES